MIVDVPLVREDLSQIRDLMDRVKRSDDVVILRGGARVIDKMRWLEILEGDCGLQSDPRHFDPEWSAREAERLKRGEIASSGVPVERQMLITKWAEISYQPDKATSYQFSSTPQPLHTDNGWFRDPPDVSFFIMEKQSPTGGEQTIYPAARLVDDLSRDAPELLQDLSSTSVVIRKGDHDQYNTTTVIKLGPKPMVFWNYYRIEKKDPAIAAMCEAFFKYLDKRVETPSVERIRAESGDAFTFNDMFLLHGRTAYTAERARDRILLHSMWKSRR
jgi:hypothetical protein